MPFAELQGSGLGLRRAMCRPLRERIEGGETPPFDFLEVAPENWIGAGGRLAQQLRWFSERYPLVCHGLSLSIGSLDPLDEAFVREVAEFLKTHNVALYSEHLSYCSDHGHMYDLMPLPFTQETVRRVSERIRRVQDILGQRLVVENVSAYLEPGKEMSEPEFICEVLAAADCDLLLDVNNVYVNSVNHGYDPIEYLRAMPTGRIRYMHLAGHYTESENLLIDTHGSDVSSPVWELLEQAYRIHGVRPTLLERDFNIPPLDDLFDELSQLRQVQYSVGEVREFS